MNNFSSVYDINDVGVMTWMQLNHEMNLLNEMKNKVPFTLSFGNYFVRYEIHAG